MFFYAPLFITTAAREDSQERTYHLCTPVAKAGTLKDKDGNVINNPAALVVYGLKKVKEGQIIKTVVQGRDGVYTAVDSASHEDALACIEGATEIKDLPLVHVREFESALDADGNEKTVRYGRKVKSRNRKNSSGSLDLSNEVTTVSTANAVEVRQNAGSIVVEEETADKPL